MSRSTSPSSPAPRLFFPSWLRVIGPGLLFAGAAIGVSHLVQSTRAGALYGLGLVGVILLANLTKYPGLSLGGRYTSATGFSLLESYRRQGRWALVLCAVLTIGTMFAVAAAVSFVTGALFNEIFLRHLFPAFPLPVATALVMAMVAALLAKGGFRWLDVAMKILLSMMAALTFVATAMALLRADFSSFALIPPARAFADKVSIGFVVALAGWMPAPLDISLWNSLWAQAHGAARGQGHSAKEARLDFNVGYSLSIALALCFVVLGTVSMHQPGIEPAAGGVAFSKQILGLFTDALGNWSRPIVALCSFSVMFSTTLTVLDAIPRVLMVTWQRFHGQEQPQAAQVDHARTRLYWVCFGLLVCGSLVLLFFFVESLGQLVDLATTLSFLTAPLFAWLNHRAIGSAEVPEAYRQSTLERRLSATCVGLLAAFALVFLYTRFVL